MQMSSTRAGTETQRTQARLQATPQQDLSTQAVRSLDSACHQCHAAFPSPDQTEVSPADADLCAPSRPSSLEGTRECGSRVQVPGVEPVRSALFLRLKYASSQGCASPGQVSLASCTRVPISTGHGACGASTAASKALHPGDAIQAAGAAAAAGHASTATTATTTFL